MCLIPQLRHDYSEAVDLKLLENFSAAQPFNAKLCEYMRSFGTQSPDDGEVLLSPPPFSHPHASDLGHLVPAKCRPEDSLPQHPGEGSLLVPGEALCKDSAQPLPAHVDTDSFLGSLLCSSLPPLTNSYVPSHPTVQTTPLCPFLLPAPVRARTLRALCSQVNVLALGLLVQMSLLAGGPSSPAETLPAAIPSHLLLF